MRAINHALTGAVIGGLSGDPLVAIPAAFVSHFICDTIPHFGEEKANVEASESFKIMLIIDTVLCAGLVAVLAIWRPEFWLLMSMCAFIAAAPDFWSLKRYLRIRQGKKYEPGRIARFTSFIQWFERPIGAVVELAWAAGAIFLLINLT